MSQRYFLSFFFFVFGASASTIHTLTSTKSLKEGDVLISDGSNTFALGFFSPGNSTGLRYLGIWYNKIPVQTVVWVANKDQPIKSSIGMLSLSKDGNLVLSSDNSTVWSAKIPFPSHQQPTGESSSTAAKLLDSGNFVLLHGGGGGSNQRVAWQSFDYPTHVFLPGMKLGLDRKTGLSWSLTSWKSDGDPASGNYSFRLDPDGSPEFFIYKGDNYPVWRTGPWVGQKWSGVPEMTRGYIFNYSFVDHDDEIYVSYGVRNASIVSIFLLDGESGTVQRMTWHESRGQWIKFWSAPGEDCDEYAKCGPYGTCNPGSDQFKCSCFPGYHPKSPRDWFLRDGSEGCTRDGNRSMCHNGEGFLRLTSIKVPNTSRALVNMSMGTLEDCEKKCLKNCSCTAYTSAGSSGGGSGYGNESAGCILFYSDLIDTREYSDGEGQDIYFRVDAVELAKSLSVTKDHPANKKLLVILPLSAVLISMVLLSSACWFLMKKRREWKDVEERSLWLKETEDQNEGRLDLPVYDLNAIVTATQNFSSTNKLGEGGFGAVYKGVLSTGQEIAVKRLAKNSGQGMQEFKNEVRLIAKLQHRNLVKTLGCCVRGEEKMLIYEFLPNKSLDKYIFNEEKRSLLDWRKRYDIILGVARGILYLHQDSRFRIIHRDLKASNVLLDATMTPKISDFGMARIFGNDQIEANTNRVVGTYGYMSPEYAMHGLISVKSDVFSFGVLSLEIICGKKNRGFFNDHLSLSLTGHVWQLWKDGRAKEIVDPSILPGSSNDFHGDDDDEDEILRCIQIGLLCVQEDANERPNMLEVVFMLSNKTKLSSPKEPAFVIKGGAHRTTSKSGDPSSSSTGAHCSVYDVTSTTIEAR